MRLFKQIDLKEGELVQYVGVYVTRWQPEWGQPSIGFVEIDKTEQANAADEYKTCEYCGEKDSTVKILCGRCRM